MLEKMSANFILIVSSSLNQPSLHAKNALTFGGFSPNLNMRRTFFILVLLSIWFTTNAQLGNKEFTETCIYLVEIDTTHKTKEMLYDLWKVNAVTLGDSGESNNPEFHLSRFYRFINYFDSAYHDTTLVKIIENNYCGLVSCYAFAALVTKSESVVSNQLPEELMSPFAQDTTSFVYLDWGCGRSKMETFDYMLTIVREHHQEHGADYNFANNKALVESLLTLRKPYYRDTGNHQKKISWEFYSRGILHRYK